MLFDLLCLRNYKHLAYMKHREFAIIVHYKNNQSYNNDGEQSCRAYKIFVCEDPLILASDYTKRKYICKKNLPV